MENTKIGLGLAALGRPEYINVRDDSSVDKSFESFKKHANEILDFGVQQRSSLF